MIERGKLDGPTEIVLDTSVYIGAIREQSGKETGDAYVSLKRTGEQKHKVIISKKVVEEIQKILQKRGIRLTDSLIPFMLVSDLRRIEDDTVEGIRLGISPPKSASDVDIHVMKTAVALKKKGITICILHKNPRDFNQIKDNLYEEYGIFVLTPKDYNDP